MLKCRNGHYTLRKKCHVCGTPASGPHPAKFSPEKEKKWGEYRRKAKKGK